MTLVGIHKGVNGEFYDYLERYETVLKHNNIESIRLETGQPDFWQRVAELDLFIFRWSLVDTSKQMAQTILPIVEREVGIKCFPDTATCWHYDDKIRQHLMLDYHGYPVIDSWIFWKEREALTWLDEASFPLVFKLKAGSASHNVLLVENRGEARKLVKRMFRKGALPGEFRGVGSTKMKDFDLKDIIRRRGARWVKILKGENVTPFWQINKNYALFQRFLPGNDHDTRVVVIGNRAMAFRRFNRKNDFRASGNDEKDLDPKHIDREFLKIAFEISGKLGFQCMAYDFIYDQDKKPRVIEMSYTFPDRTIPNCPGYWDPDMNWHEGKNWAQYFQLVDALGRPDLKQPEMS